MTFAGARWALLLWVFGVPASLCHQPGHHLSCRRGELMTFEDLIAAARRTTAQVYSTQTYQSQPIPGRSARGPTVMFMYGPQAAREGSATYWATEHVVEFDAQTGALLSTREYHGAIPPGFTGGDFSLPPGMSLDEFEGKRTEYYAALERVRWPYAEQSAPTPELIAAARAVRDLEPAVLETPLIPFYRAVGADFFAWIDRTAR